MNTTHTQPTTPTHVPTAPITQMDRVQWADRAMQLATDFAVESLRVGSCERRDRMADGGVYSWETVQLRERRDLARDRLRHWLYTEPLPPA